MALKGMHIVTAGFRAEKCLSLYCPVTKTAIICNEHSSEQQHYCFFFEASQTTCQGTAVIRGPDRYPGTDEDAPGVASEAFDEVHTGNFPCLGLTHLGFFFIFFKKKIAFQREISMARHTRLTWLEDWSCVGLKARWDGS